MPHKVLISRDPFAREEIVRKVENDASCKECGGRNAYGSIFRYGVERDDQNGRTHWDRDVFCSKGCRTTYYE